MLKSAPPLLDVRSKLLTSISFPPPLTPVKTREERMKEEEAMKEKDFLRRQVNESSEEEKKGDRRNINKERNLQNSLFFLL